MNIFNDALDITIPKVLLETYQLEDILFFDIETTGFAFRNSQIYLIGCLYFKDNIPFIRQFFANHMGEETEILNAFFQFSKNFNTLIHFNGHSFDIPYLLGKCKFFEIKEDFSRFTECDIYKLIAPYKKLFNLPNLKQKTIEEFSSIHRKDKYNGGELIPVYHSYAKEPKQELLDILLLHNHEDLEGMLKLSALLSLKYFHAEQVQYQDWKINNDSVLFSLKLAYPLPFSFHYQGDFFSVHSEGEDLFVSVPIYSGTLKYFYSDYKNYYYLPFEDMAIHKSVAEYIDKNCRQKARASTCYSKKEGCFLMQPYEILSPAFRQEYKDKVCYFSLEELKNTNTSLLCTYIFSLIQMR